MPDYQHNFFKATPHSTSMPSSEVSQLKHAQGAIHICKPVFRCYEIGKYTKKNSKFFQKCKSWQGGPSSKVENLHWDWDCAKCKMLNPDQRRCGLVCTQFGHIAWFKIQTKEDTVRTRWALHSSWGASLPPASNISVPLCPCNPIHPEPEESGAMNVDKIGRVT